MHNKNLFEKTLIFQKGTFDYGYVKKLDHKVFEESKVELSEYQKDKWILSVWDITNVLPFKGRLEEGIAAFPDEIPRRLIKLFSFVGETVLDPFLGSGTTSKVTKELGRNSIGYEIDLELKPMIMKKLGFGYGTLTEDKIEFFERHDARRLRSFLQEGVRKQRSVTEIKKGTPKALELAPQMRTGELSILTTKTTNKVGVGEIRTDEPRPEDPRPLLKVVREKIMAEMRGEKLVNDVLKLKPHAKISTIRAMESKIKSGRL